MSVPKKKRLTGKEIQVTMAESTDSETQLLDDDSDSFESSSDQNKINQPPPPGCLPTASQMAAAQGQNVVVTQRKGDFVTGGSDGGMVIW